MVKVIPFRRDHLAELKGDVATSWYLDALENNVSVSVVTDRVIAAGGVLPQANGGGILWSALSPLTGPHMLQLTRVATRLMDASGLRRLEATVEEGFAPGCRWLSILGFNLETPYGMRSYGPTGKTHYLYGWVRA